LGGYQYQFPASVARGGRLQGGVFVADELFGMRVVVVCGVFLSLYLNLFN
jgi:hypothetical protein